MKQLLDFIPLIIFFTVYKLHDIYAATGALMATTLLQMIVVWVMYKKTGTQPLDHSSVSAGFWCYDTVLP